MRDERSAVTWSFGPGALLLLVVVGCHDLSGLAGTQALPAGTPNPSVYHTAAGALALYQTTVAAFQNTYGVQTSTFGSRNTDTTAGAFVDFMVQSGLLTDELQAGDLGCTGACSAGDVDKLDARLLPEGAPALTDQLYGELQGIRNDAVLGIGALATYDPQASPALQGHLHALAGYAELMLADLFCSGVPLGHVTFNGEFSYAPSSTTSQVYRAALAQFDTALSLSDDSTRIENLAWVGKARALLAIAVDDFPQAAQAAAHVPDGFAYTFVVDWTGRSGALFTDQNATVANQEGVNGLPFIVSGDPRTAADSVSQNSYGRNQYSPVKYGGATPGFFPISVGDWIEARLIQAEAALHANPQDPTWLTLLNTLRQTATVTGQTTPLAPLTDPGDSPGDTARVNLLFRERASWLFLTGHRQGDLRRLIRQYHDAETGLYPIGPYPNGVLGSYGSDVTAPIPTSETVDPAFHGCLSRGA